MTNLFKRQRKPAPMSNAERYLRYIERKAKKAAGIQISLEVAK